MKQLTGLDASYLYLETSNAPMHIAGLAIYGTGPVMDGRGPFHVVGSYCGEFVISATAHPQMMPDPACYRDCLQQSFQEPLQASEYFTQEIA